MTFQEQVKAASDERLANSVLHCHRVIETTEPGPIQNEIKIATARGTLQVLMDECERRGLEPHTP